MNNFFLFSIFCLISSIIVFKMTKGEIFSCSFITNFSMGIGSLLMYPLSMLWGIDLHSKTIVIVGSALVITIIAEYLAKKNKKNFVQKQEYNPIRIKYVNWLLLLYLVISCLYVYSVFKIGGSFDSTAIGEVKSSGSLNQMNPFIKQGYKLIISANVIHSIIFSHNVFLAKSSFIKEIKHLFPFVLMCVVGFASGGRLRIFITLISLLFIMYLFLREKSQWKKLYLRKIAFVVLPTITIYLIFFSVVQVVIKGKNEENRKDNVEYISYYIGSPLHVFNIKLKNEEKWSYDTFGFYTFNGLYNMLNINDSKSKDIGNGMTSLGGKANYAGNAMTVFGGSYFDFGFGGMLLFIFVSYYIFAKYYYKKILYTTSSYIRNKRVALYSYAYTSIILMSFYDNCYWIFLSSTGLLTIFLIYVMYRIYFNKLLIRRYN